VPLPTAPASDQPVSGSTVGPASTTTSKQDGPSQPGVPNQPPSE
jgi:hypothetical protein